MTTSARRLNFEKLHTKQPKKCSFGVGAKWDQEIEEEEEEEEEEIKWKQMLSKIAISNN